MRIMHVLKHTRASNGHVHVAVDLACVQADQGHEVTVASSGGPYDDLLRAHGVVVAFVPEATRAVNTPRSERALLGAARRARPHIVHSHMMSSTVLALPIVKLTKARLVTTVHNSFDSHSWLMRLGDVVVAVSEAEELRLIEAGFPRRKLTYVLNGAVDSPRQKAYAQSATERLPVPCVASLSGLHQRKAVDDIIRAFSAALSSVPGWHLNVLGGGPDRDRLERLVDDLGLRSSIQFFGTVSAPWPLLEQADIFVSASVDEPFGLSVAEARAAGCAIVATAVGGVPEVVDQGRAGRLVPVSDHQALTDVLVELMQDETERSAWQARAMTGIDRFTVRRMAEDYEAVYRSVLHPAAGPR